MILKINHSISIQTEAVSDDLYRKALIEGLKVLLANGTIPETDGCVVHNTPSRPRRTKP